MESVKKKKGQTPPLPLGTMTMIINKIRDIDRLEFAPMSKYSVDILKTRRTIRRPLDPGFYAPSPFLANAGDNAGRLNLLVSLYYGLA